VLEPRHAVAVVALALLAAVAAACRGVLDGASPHGALVAAPACLTGIYRSPGGANVALTQRAGHPGSLRINDLEGRTGALEPAERSVLATAAPRPDDHTAITAVLGQASCDDSGIAMQLDGGPEQRWARLPLRVTRTRFESGPTELDGELIEPSTASGRAPLFVFVHGSESTAAVGTTSLPYLMAIEGIASFVFDKRGTGASGGTYTQNFEVLADDVVAAVLTARRLAGDRATRVGIAGFSQGGWVAPLAAAKTPVDFVVVGYGVVGTPLEQDAWQVAHQLHAAGFSDADVANALAITDLTANVAASDFRTGIPELRAAVQRYGGERWLAKVDGQFSGELVRGEVDRARSESPGVMWRYDAMAVLRRLDVPQLWVFARDDSIAPSAPSIARLQTLQRAGKPIEIAVFPDADHGIHEVAVSAGGTRTLPGYAKGYHRLLADWMNGRSASSYGAAVLKRIAESGN
jgi:pimeloyl-ACP methyl ester carboxylesterase